MQKQAVYGVFYWNVKTVNGVQVGYWHEVLVDSSKAFCLQEAAYYNNCLGVKAQVFIKQ